MDDRTEFMDDVDALSLNHFWVYLSTQVYRKPLTFLEESRFKEVRNKTETLI